MGTIGLAILKWLLSKWKYIVVGVAFLAAYLWVAHAWHTQLKAAYDAGVADQKATIERQEYQIRQQSQEIGNLQARILSGQLDQNQKTSEVITKDVDHYITVTETKFVNGSCHPDADYLSLWDRAVSNQE